MPQTPQEYLALIFETLHVAHLDVPIAVFVVLVLVFLFFGEITFRRGGGH